MSEEQLGTLVVVCREGMGHGDPELKKQLFGAWLKLVQQDGRLPGAMAFYTEGVLLARRGSAFTDDLRALEEKGVRLILCKTCTDRFGITDDLAVGIVGGMGDILAAQWQAKKVIAL